MSLYLEGVVLGLPLMFLMGPVLVTLLQESLQKGFAGGFFVALGIIVGDTLCLLLYYWGLSQVVSASWTQQAFTIGGSLVLFAFGLGVFFSKPPEIPELMDNTPTSFSMSFVKGFLINFVNPFVLTFWLGCMSLAKSRLGNNFSAVGLFFLGTLTVIFVSDVSKAYLASFLKRWIKSKALLVLNRITGIFLLVSGIYLFTRPFLK
ncbi:MAG: LysE family translocator [Myxococcales bacterium]|nr:LysE family translocator [Myxococcales bacterium]